MPVKDGQAVCPIRLAAVPRQAISIQSMPIIVQVIWQEFGVRYHPSSVWHILRKMGWSSQRPQRRPFQRDDEAIEEWKDEVLPEIKKNAVN